MSSSPREDAPEKEEKDDEQQDETLNQGRQRRRAKKMRHASIHDDDDSSSHEDNDSSSEDPFGDDNDNNDTAEVSLNDLKHSILGRSVRTEDDEEAEDHDVPDATAGKPLSTAELRSSLTCAICHELLWQPVAVPCGHAFCHGCLEWWWHHAAQAAACPTCRRPLPVILLDDDDDDDNDHNHQTNVALFRKTYHVSAVLRACLQTNFPDAYQQRAAAAAAAQRRATAGEDGGAHTAGYEILQPSVAAAWKSIATCTDATLQWRRCVVRDAMDQRMQLALALYQTTSNDVESVVDWRAGILHLTLCLLIMEEDEVQDSGGFPAIVQANSDAAHLIVSDAATRFAAVPVEVCVELTPTRSVPVTRRTLHDDGTVTFTLDTNQDIFTDGDSNISLRGRPLTFLFCHAETQTEFHLRVPPPAADTFSGKNNETRLREIRPTQKKEKRYLAYHQDDQSEENEDDEAQDEFEHDGFVVHGDDDDEEDDEHNNDICAVCRDGGDMMVCDGGDVIAGCGKSFHIQCVRRDEIPEGDWICETCALEHGLGEVGIMGHEFPPDDTHNESKGNEEEDAPPEGNANIASSDEEDAGAAAFSDADEDDDEGNDGDKNNPAAKRAAAFSDSEEEESPVKVSKPAAKRQRIIDSDEDDE